MMPQTKMQQTKIQVQAEPFDQNAVYQWLSEPHSVGATTLFVGKVREMNLGDSVSGLYLEHYPAMTEKALNEIVEEARQRWDLQRVAVIHRIGQLHTGDEIVLVGVSSAHRGDAYAANEFIMDYLKTKAPFWKRETTEQGERWIEGRNCGQTPDQRQLIARWAKEFDLYASVGSDFHYPTGWIELGRGLTLPKECKPIWERF